MAEAGPYPSFYIPDDGTAYLPGDLVRVDHSSDQPRIVKDEDGEYEVVASRRATELRDGPPMLRINLRRLAGYRR